MTMKLTFLPMMMMISIVAVACINVALLHSASNFKGYEVVIKQLVDSEYNEWEDLETKNVWHSSGTEIINFTDEIHTQVSFHILLANFSIPS